MQDLTFAPEPLQSQGRTLTENVFKQIQTAIVLGQIPAGSKISEPELARTYGISRGPLREAIHRLEGQRLVERTAHVGARVVSLSLQQFKELYQIRASLEGLACKLAAQHIDKKQILALRDVLRMHAEDENFKAGKGYYLQEGQDDFHYCIIKSSGNKTLENAMR